MDSNEWNLLKTCSQNINNNSQNINTEVINLLSKYADSSKLDGMWISILEAVGFYPYLEKLKYKLIANSTGELIMKEYYSSKYLDNIYFHAKQKELVEKIYSQKNLIVSAPTSFGKSLIIEEIVASEKYKNIIIIQPSLALIDETRKKLAKYINNYKIIIHTSQLPSNEKGNLFLFTAERVLEYNYFNNIDYLIVDEFYKLSKTRDDERADILNNSIHMILNIFKCQLLMLGPNIDNVSERFVKRYNAEFVKYEYNLVNNEQVQIYDKIENFSRKQKEEYLFDLLWKLKNEKTIIYCSSPNRARKLSCEFLKYLLEKRYYYEAVNEKQFPLIEWIEVELNKKWYLSKLLKCGIGVHDGTMPKHINSSIIKYFNGNNLNWLFCTTTIIEGVNTSAKNIIYFDNTKGMGTKIDYFDYCNIKGRAGRMMIHYVGKIYNFNKPPQKEITSIDIPFCDQKNISDEILINLDKDEVLDSSQKQYQKINEIPIEIRNIIKKNGISVMGQYNVLMELDKLFEYSVLQWSGMPKYEQLEYILNLAWDNFIIRGETIGRMTIKKLVYSVYNYGLNRDVKKIINSNYDFLKNDKKKNVNDDDIYDEAIQLTFQTIRHWFHYKVPKWLRVMNTLQEYVCHKKKISSGNYLYYANIIENEGVETKYLELLEYNLPSTTIKKLDEKLVNVDAADQVIPYIIKNKLYNIDSLLSYEKELIVDNILN